jgi:Family of unknown function (DUF6131)
VLVPRILTSRTTVVFERVGILWTIGIILIVVGAILWILGSMGRAVGPRTHYW